MFEFEKGVNRKVRKTEVARDVMHTLTRELQEVMLGEILVRKLPISVTVED